MQNITYCNTVEAKTHLNQLLDEVAKGKIYIVKRRGIPIARIIPTSPAIEKAGIATNTQIFKDISRLHQKIKKTRKLKSKTVQLIRELREES